MDGEPIRTIDKRPLGVNRPAAFLRSEGPMAKPIHSTTSVHSKLTHCFFGMARQAGYSRRSEPAAPAPPAEAINKESFDGFPGEMGRSEETDVSGH